MSLASARISPCSADAPSLDIVYKLTEFGGEGRVKLSVGKRSLPGRKQIFRSFEHGTAIGDTIARADEKLPGTPLLGPVMLDGKRVEPAEPVSAMRERCRAELARMPEDIRRIGKSTRSYPVNISPALDALDRNVRKAITRTGSQKDAQAEMHDQKNA